ncbi:universal stress protein [Methylomonas paludis]|uniref:Universal stress protein n=1 Tax=Methylomonas paludis TaxID=1173101 RepID=A0A975R9Z7_9GAMM|nr:universal stress protein [Methylomonas paludis]QWF70803.1 universal stress protein [Methylomonas paludis]
MALYKHILLAVDFSDHSHAVANTAKQIAAQNQAKFSIVYVVDNLPLNSDPFGPIQFDVDLTQELLDNAKTRLKQVAATLEIPENQQWLEMGNPKLEIVRIAEEQQADLIVIGSHGRHGLALLLGSTANGVLHHAKVDVLAVRLKDS